MAQRQLRGAAAQPAVPAAQPPAAAPNPAAAQAAPSLAAALAAPQVPAGQAAPAPPAPVRAWATPDKFSGDRNSDWRTWRLQFETVAAVNNWTPQHQVAYIGLYLSGAALSYYHSLDVQVRQGPLQALLQLLEQRFNAPQQAELFRAELQSRRQRASEPLSDYCEAVRRLVRYAYPALPPQVQDMLAKDQFLGGIDSRDIRIRVRTANPGTLDDTLQQALQMQAILNTDAADTPPQVAVHATTSPVANPAPELAVVLQRLEQLETKLSSATAAKPTPSAPQRACWICGDPGHMQNRCPHRPAQPDSGSRRTPARRGRRSGNV